MTAEAIAMLKTKAERLVRFGLVTTKELVDISDIIHSNGLKERLTEVEENETFAAKKAKEESKKPELQNEDEYAIGVCQCGGTILRDRRGGCPRCTSCGLKYCD